MRSAPSNAAVRTRLRILVQKGQFLGNGRPSPALWSDYVAFPARRRIQQIVADRFGTFEGAWVPDGDYLVAPVRTVPEFWMPPEFLKTLVPVATPVRVELGGRQSVELRLP